jgi:UDP-glucose 4-epimerase
VAKYLVTGGCGFIGSHLVERLIKLGHEARVLDDLSSGRRANLPLDCEVLVGDVADEATVRRAMADVDGCFHLAAVASVVRCNEDWLGTHRVNQSGAIAVFEGARSARHGEPVPVVYASSAAVYGDSDAVPLSERVPPRPLTAYGADKFGAELHARVATLVHGVPTVGFRFFNVYGPRQDPRSPYSGVISIFADRILRGRPIQIFGDGKQVRDFVYVEDVVNFLVAGMLRPRRHPEVYNVCRGRATSIWQLAQTLAAICGTTADASLRPPRPGDIYRSLGDPRKAKEELGCCAETELEDGLRKTLRSLTATTAVCS